MEFRNPEGVKKGLLGNATKAYENMEFLQGSEGRIIRIISEYQYPEQYLRKYGIKGTIVFYGSARTLSLDEFDLRLKELNDKFANAPIEQKEYFSNLIDAFMKTYDMTNTYNETVILSMKLSEWLKSLEEEQKIVICTGGGPGMMEAANRGAQRAGTPSIGLNISLPFEQYPNNYITPDLNFEFHYFFMRKFWFSHLAKAIIAMPGGLGTLDELFDILTLVQTKKITKKLPIILYNEKYWRKLINFDYLVEMGMINKEDLSLFKFCDTTEEAFEYLKENIDLND
ncbi:MAG TPA: TIGR00730 family Rossman fold protein [Candidatus Kapabacteria bacterium]|nr:TIGR00730 family Rossman fold protein [Candidatus Kapabacteria bacterium]